MSYAGQCRRLPVCDGVIVITMVWLHYGNEEWHVTYYHNVGDMFGNSSVGGGERSRHITAKDDANGCRHVTRLT